MLIPIGAWCRTAYQVNEFLKVNGIKPTSFPYDWTITPFAALKTTFNKNFNQSDILNIESLKLNILGSITDSNTKLIHHHDFEPYKMKRFGKIGNLDDIGFPKDLYLNYLIEKAKGRFAHTYGHLEALRSCRNKIAFVRWYRSGHPDLEFPEAFKGESFANLAGIISEFLLHDNFSILTVKSQYVYGELPSETIVEYERNKYGISSTIVERKEIIYDIKHDFKGDTVVWHKLLDKFVEDEQLTLS